MTNQDSINQAGDGKDYTMLVNPDRVRSSIRRLFDNSLAQIVGEILQNSQRSLATKVAITTTDDGFIIQDDGHGILNGVDGFYTLLKIAESAFETPTLSDQDPMGLGICSLLAHDKVSLVTFASGKLSISIDTSRWWWDEPYYKTWRERLVSLDESVGGFRITASCHPDMIKELNKLFLPSTYYSDSHPVIQGQGYYDILSITLNGNSVETGNPSWTRISVPLVKTEYKGSSLEVGFAGDARNSSELWSSVNFYGQIIPVQFRPGSRFKFYLHVRRGRPVNPLSPTRDGLIRDTAYTEFMQHVKDLIFAYLCDPANRASITPAMIEGLYSMDADRARRECPYIVAKELLPTAEIGSSDDIDECGEAELLTYDEAPEFLAPWLTVIEGDDTSEAEYGLNSFLPMVGTAYTLKYGDEARLTVKKLWWRPGRARREFFVEPGEWAIAAGDEAPKRWQPVTSLPVYAFKWPDNWDVLNVEWLGAACADEVEFLRREAWAAFDPHNDDQEYDYIRDSYEGSLLALIMRLVGNCVPHDFTHHSLHQFFSDRQARITCVTYNYDGEAAAFAASIGAQVMARMKYKMRAALDGGRGPLMSLARSAAARIRQVRDADKAPTKAASQGPTSITATNAAGERVTLRLL